MFRDMRLALVLGGIGHGIPIESFGATILHFVEGGGALLLGHKTFLSMYKVQTSPHAVPGPFTRLTRRLD